MSLHCARCDNSIDRQRTTSGFVTETLLNGSTLCDCCCQRFDRLWCLEDLTVWHCPLIHTPDQYDHHEIETSHRCCYFPTQPTLHTVIRQCKKSRSEHTPHLCHHPRFFRVPSSAPFHARVDMCTRTRSLCGTALRSLSAAHVVTNIVVWMCGRSGRRLSSLVFHTASDFSESICWAVMLPTRREPQRTAEQPSLFYRW